MFNLTFKTQINNILFFIGCFFLLNVKTGTGIKMADEEEKHVYS